MMSVVVGASLSVLFNELFDKLFKKIDGIKPKDVQVVNVKQDPNEFSRSILDDTTTTETQFKDLKTSPQLTFENPLEKEAIVEQIDIIPDTAFKTKGKCIITVDDIPVFQSKNFTSFTLISEDVIKVNKTIDKDSKVKVFMISSDGTAVGLAVQVRFGE